MGKRFSVLFFFLLIFSLFLLTGHVHLHDDGAHCPFCALINTGLCIAVPFHLYLFFAVLMAIGKNPQVILCPEEFLNTYLRSPPLRLEPAR